MNFTKTYFLILAVSVALAILSGTIKNFPYLVVIFSLPMFLLPETFEGSRGIMGFYGDPGVMGPKGPLGYTGDTGYVGYKGPEGQTGPVGPLAPWPQYRGPPGDMYSNKPQFGTLIQLGALSQVVIPGDFVGVFIGLEYQGQNYSLFRLKSSLVAKEPIKVRKYYDQAIVDKELVIIQVRYTLTFADPNDRTSKATLTFTQSLNYIITFRQSLTVKPNQSDLKPKLDEHLYNIPNVVRYVKVIRKV